MDKFLRIGMIVAVCGIETVVVTVGVRAYMAHEKPTVAFAIILFVFWIAELRAKLKELKE